jgi:hypothetical protein
MDFLKKNKLIVGLFAIILVVLGVGFVLMNSRGQNNEVTPGDQTENIKKLQPSDIGLELSLRDDSRAVILKVTKLEGIKSLEYEVSYDSEEEVEGELQNVPDGAYGEVSEIEGESEIEREIILGTCSATCRYDKVTSDITVVVKVNFENGEVGEVEDKIALGE